MYLFSTLSTVFNNSFYYSESFVLFIGFFLLFLLLLVIRFIHNIIKITKTVNNNIINFGVFLTKHEIETLLWLLLSVLISRFVISYGNVSSGFRSPEKTIALYILGADFQTGVIMPIMYMIRGNNFYNIAASYGPAISITLAPIIKSMLKQGICQYDNNIGCLSVIYPWLVSIIGIVYIFLICVLKQTNRFREKTMILLGIIFLGISGAFALDRGNLDLLFSGIMSIYVALFLSGKKINVFMTSCLGLILGYIISAKIFLVIFIVPFLLFVPNPLIFGIFLTGTWIVLSYVPALYGVVSGPTVLFKTAFIASKATSNLFLVPVMLSYNDSLQATASLVSVCRQIRSCNRENFLELISYYFVIVILFCSVFLLPLVDFVVDILRKIRKISVQVLVIMKNIRPSSWAIIILCIGTAIINTIPESTYVYRIVYSLPVIILLLAYTEVNRNSKAYLMLSIVCFSIKNMWTGQLVNPLVFSVFDPRILNVFLFLHYYFLIKSGLAIFAEDFIFQAKKFKLYEKN